MLQRRWRTALTSITALALALSYAWAAQAGTETGDYAAGATITAASLQTVRIGLVWRFKDVKQVTLLASCHYVVARTASNEKLVTCTNLEPVTIAAAEKSLSLTRANGTKVDVGTSVTVTPGDPGGTITVDSPGRPSKQYHGTLEVSLKSGSLLLVNSVHIEDYLVGVLAGEMPASYPIEAQKAQAVAARNFTLRSLRRHASAGYDLCDDSHCQVYDGSLRESPARVRAVLATAGQVATYHGQLASTMYCSDCGGVTECYAEGHKDSVPYLATVTEPAGTAHRGWEEFYKLAELSAKLVAAGIEEADGLTKVAITKTSSSGRALVVELTGAKGSVSVDGVRLRLALGRDAIRSTLFAVETAPDGTVTFKGKGFGHGIGLCQVGAKALADPPFNYTFDRILAHYYPGTTLSGIGTKQVGATGRTAPQPSPQRGGSSVADTQRGESAPVEVRVVEPRL